MRFINPNKYYLVEWLAKYFSPLSFAYPYIARMLLQAGAKALSLPQQEKDKRTDYWSLQQLHKYAPPSMKENYIANNMLLHLLLLLSMQFTSAPC